MTPELLRDVEAVLDAVINRHRDRTFGFITCRFCGAVDAEMQPIKHRDRCEVLLAKRIREGMKDPSL